MTVLRVIAAFLCAASVVACGQGGDEAVAQPADAFELHPLDIIQGNPDAPVTIVEYASAGCPACAQFHMTVYPELKEAYVDTGKVRFILREFRSGDPVLFQTGALLARCVPEDKYYAVIDQLFRQFNELYQARREGNAREAYLRIARRASLSDEAFDACIADEALLVALFERAEADLAKYPITGTPSFVINGELARGVRVFEDFADVIDPLLDDAATAALDAG